MGGSIGEGSGPEASIGAKDLPVPACEEGAAEQVVEGCLSVVLKG